ncbi:MAG: protein-L-isoaspartate(D-aspartate) O-methyltransferase [Flavobacteriales bacterium]|nr:protein-L-isoaspartate(D-aspartate) O-methyltransferase [Flavobacteriales bacterium]MCW8913420.1 protein-L-isoaspartate(D-aspartate) O-methyltransferase [Flavobacteriales bacterium]MCW8938516.1 protein-L-isoaspartate(D-aspartate) O-methyltransferase [Flavobacteriales bacterium]MCW8940130.1 protein-L-isoaspartate(D-aspartate) O-methyltransferase [Flavobacteriales bacterium]MCW8967465.1 protein-L-isoaspartate(D-aspartate) O-methyltransferase [Flavobacteriales bacterium]
MDSYRHKGLRKKLTEILAKKGITDSKVLDAIANIPRHLFIADTALHQFAYEDKPFPIGSGQTISQPYTVAFQTQTLEIKPRDKVLEIGTGSGYQTAVLLELGAKVFSIERQKALYDRTKEFLPKLGYNAKLFYGDGYLGLPTYAPFNKIIVTAGAPYVPENLLKQLAIGGIMVIPVDNEDHQIMKKIVKIDENNFETTELGTFRFVPLLKEKGRDL